LPYKYDSTPGLKFLSRYPTMPRGAHNAEPSPLLCLLFGNHMRQICNDKSDLAVAQLVWSAPEAKGGSARCVLAAPAMD
jgi:hypothetical protein